MRRWCLLALFATFLLALAGCGEKVHVGGQPRPKEIQSIVSLSPSTTEILGGYQLLALMKGRTAACDFPPPVQQVAVVVDGTKPDYEKIASIRPDLIVYDAKLYGPADVEMIKKLGAQVLAMDVNSVAELSDFLLRLGSTVGFELPASEGVDRIYAASARALSNMGERRPKAIAMMAGGNGTYMAAGSGSFQADVLRMSGSTPVGPDGKLFVAIGPEELIRLDPEYIFTAGGADRVLADPRLASVNAVKAKRVYDVDESVLLRTGYRTELLIEALNDELVKSAP